VLHWFRSEAWLVSRSASVASRMLATVQYLMATAAFVPTTCSLIDSEGADSDADRTRPIATRYTRYAPASKQRKTLPVRGWRMNLCSCGIMSLTFIKPGAD